MSNPFALPTEEYRRDLNVIKHTVEQYATFLNKMTGRDYEQCLEYVKSTLRPGGRFEFRDPKIVYMERQENGDRVRKEGTLAVYLRESMAAGELIAPTLTTYIPATKKESLLAQYIDRGVKARSVAKKEKFKAKMDGNMVLHDIKDHEQNNKKLGNNAISGAHVTPSTPLYNKTAHSTLTSNCRSTSGYGNANNEKFLNGNRHYWSYDIVINNITSIIRNTNLDELDVVIKKYGIQHPTVRQTMECIEFSAKEYWRDRYRMDLIREYVKRLSPVERSAFVYIGDLYHLMKHNEAVVRSYLDALTHKATDPIESVDDASAIIKAAPEDAVALANQICCDVTKGIKMDDMRKDQPETYGIVAATVRNVEQTNQRFADLIRAFWVTDNVPASVAFFPTSIRKAALTSDTDSTIFTVQDWVSWHHGEAGFERKHMATAATMIYLAAQSIVHVLARMSANFGIEQKRLYQIAMKNEFKFDVFVPTQVAKHYYAIISCQEGNLYANHDVEIKGVHLKASDAPIEITKRARSMMEEIMYTVVRGEKIYLTKYLKEIGDIERNIFASIQRGDPTYFRRARINPPESYTKGPTESNYRHHMMWNEVMGSKYGEVTDPPYGCIKLTTTLDSATRTRAWLESLTDQSVATRMRGFMERFNKKYIGTVYLPSPVLELSGIPEEFLPMINQRKMVINVTKVFYLILESLGYYVKSKDGLQLISDHY